MVLSDDGEDKLGEKYDELCLDLNMDKKTKEEAWKNYEKIKKNYTLEVTHFRKSAIFCILLLLFFSNRVLFHMQCKISELHYCSKWVVSHLPCFYYCRETKYTGWPVHYTKLAGDLLFQLLGGVQLKEIVFHLQDSCDRQNLGII